LNILKKYPPAPFGDAWAWLLGAVVLMVAVGLSAEAILTLVIHTPSPAEAAARIGLWPGLTSVVRPEPVKNALYVLLAPLGTVIAALAAWASRRSRLPVPLTWAVRVLAVGGGLVIAWWLVRMNWLTMLPPIPSPPEETVLAQPLRFVLFAALFGGLAAGLAWRNAGWTAVVLALVPLLFMARLSVLLEGDAYAEVNHFEVFSYPIFQDWLGQGLFVGDHGQKSQYGMYAIFLRPLWKIFGPPTVAHISAVMAVLLVCSQCAIVGFMARFSLNRVLGVVFALAAILTAQLLYPVWPGDPYFQIFPIRLVFPGLALAFLALGFVKKPQQWVAVPLLCLGLLWNFESGLVAVALYVTYAMALEFEPNWRSFMTLVARNGLRITAGVAFSALALTLYYMARFRAGPNLALLVDSLKIFTSGFADVPMPPFGVWGIHCLIYLTSGFVAFRTLWLRPDLKEKARAAALLAMTVYGVLWFRYYQGRAEPPNLNFVSAPAICCLGLLADRALRLSDRKRVFSTVLAAAVAAAFLGALGAWASTKPFSSRSFASLFRPPEATDMNERMSRVLSLFDVVNAGPGDRLLAFAPYAGELNMKLKRPGPITASGVCQIFYQSEVDQLVSLVRDPSTKMFVMDPSFTCGYMGYSELDFYLKAEFNRLESPTLEDVSNERFGGYRRNPNCAPPGGCMMDVYVRKGTRSWMALPDLALGRPAAESSTYGVGRAELAVDGNTSGKWSDGSVAHTSDDKSPWWQVDLGADHHIGGVRIWNRTDCCGDRLGNYWVFVSKTPFQPTDTPESLRHRPDVVGRRLAAPPAPSTQLKIGADGRYVRVQLEDKNYLALAEVEVLGD
jgi:hypothetical protein